MKIESVVLKRLGPVPFWRGETRCLDELDRIYRRAAAQAGAALSAGRNDASSPPPAWSGRRSEKSSPERKR